MLSKKTCRSTRSGSAHWTATSMPLYGRRSRDTSSNKIIRKVILSKKARCSLRLIRGRLRLPLHAKGQLAAQQARWDTAKATLKRIKPLAEQNAVSQKDLDDAIGTEQAAHAAVISAQAAVDKAALDLGFTRVTSPIDGIAGIAKAQIGNLVGPGALEELTTVSTVNPIKAYINVSEREYLSVNGSGKSAENIPLELILADGSVYPHKGKLALADRQIDPTTGTLKVGSLFANPGNRLRPGGYGLVRAVMSVKKGALLIPQRSVTDMQGKYPGGGSRS